MRSPLHKQERVRGTLREARNARSDSHHRGLTSAKST